MPKMKTNPERPRLPAFIRLVKRGRFRAILTQEDDHP